MLPECRWCPDQRVGPLDFQVRREPRLLQDPRLSLRLRGQVVLRRQVLRQCRQQRIPPLVADWQRLAVEKVRSAPVRRA
jgi:hypothetical protein